MDTVAYVFILLAALIIRAVTKGRSLTQIPGDFGDAFVSAVAGDMPGVKAALSRTGDAQDPVAVSVSPTGTADAQNVTAMTPSANGDLVAMGKRLQAIGYKVSEHPAFGGVTPGAHVAGSQHYKGEAIDVNADTGFRNGEKAALDTAAVMAKAAGFNVLWQVPGHYDHLHIAVKR